MRTLCAVLAIGFVPVLLSNDVVFAQRGEAASESFSQKPERQESLSQDEIVSPEPVAGSKAVVSEPDFNAGPTPGWIWGADNAKNYVLRTTFKTSNVKAARLKASVDNVGTVFLNGKRIGSSSEWSEAMSANVAAQLVEGDNVLELVAENQGGVAAAVCKLAVQHKDGTLSYVVSDKRWTVARKRGGDTIDTASDRGKLGVGPWGNVFNGATAGYAGRVPRGVFETQPGFKVDKMFTVPKDVLGSWVCIAFDNQGRLLASDQGNKGICRITLPAVGSDEATKVERVDFSKCEFKPSGAQGMLAAFGSMYFCCNGGPGSGLYRATDTDGDDQYDVCVRLKKFRGGGEHGPHSLRLSPDGKRIYVIAGNHTDPPFKAGEDLTNADYSSRIPTNWGEDLLLPRMWDANGHARGKLAPGGWIASTDPEGKTWDIFSIGYRNPYDMAFNADGELFAYDADMEWDVGTPWYRPTRVVHATSGSEFGWRSGTGKWPTYYTDSMPPLVEIGPGSPVGVDFGYGLKFPAKYQKALYICDWTFGTMYAIHMDANQSSYTASKEEFVARSPLPLTDVAAGPDGNLYFTVGGRGTQSELYRVVYEGNESTAPATLKNPKFKSNRHLAQLASTLHRHDATFTDAMKAYEESKQGEVAGGFLTENDRFALLALKRVFQNKATAGQIRGMLQSTEKKADSSFFATVSALARAAERTGLDLGELRSQALAALQRTNFDELTVDLRLDMLRSLSLVFIRLGEPTAEERLVFSKKLDGAFPSDDWRLNRELCQILVYLDSTTIVGKTVSILNQPPQREDIDMKDLLARNAGYGRAINAMINNQPDKQQMWYAFCLRVAKVGWTPATRADYFRWFAKAQTWKGGNSFTKFLQNIENEAYALTTENERVMLEAVGARTPYKVPELPKPTGPGKEWTLAEVRQLSKDHLKDRDFDNGMKMFAATRCIVCHRFSGDGGATGPDLTQLAGRFNIDALTEAMIDPSKVISDQYKASTVVTSSGKTINGRIVSDNEQQISVLTDPEDSTKVVDIARDDIEEILPASVSIMPKGLLNPLNEDEVLDLMAYLLSRGDRRSGMFKKPAKK